MRAFRTGLVVVSAVLLAAAGHARATGPAEQAAKTCVFFEWTSTAPWVRVVGVYTEQWGQDNPDKWDCKACVVPRLAEQDPDGVLTTLCLPPDISPL